MSDYMKVTDGVNVIEIVGDKMIADIDGKTEIFEKGVDISQVFRYIHLVKEANFLKKKFRAKE
jgi:hypothetical protein